MTVALDRIEVKTRSRIISLTSDIAIDGIADRFVGLCRGLSSKRFISLEEIIKSAMDNAFTGDTVRQMIQAPAVITLILSAVFDTLISILKYHKGFKHLNI